MARPRTIAETETGESLRRVIEALEPLVKAFEDRAILEEGST